MTIDSRKDTALGKLLHRREALKVFGASLAAASLGTAAEAQQTPARGGILKVAAPNNPTSLDPYTGGGGLDHTHLYNIFDNLSFKVDGSTVTLMGQVARPTLKSDAERVVKGIEGRAVGKASQKANLHGPAGRPRP